MTIIQIPVWHLQLLKQHNQMLSEIQPAMLNIDYFWQLLYIFQSQCPEGPPLPVHFVVYDLLTRTRRHGLAKYLLACFHSFSGFKKNSPHFWAPDRQTFCSLLIRISPAGAGLDAPRWGPRDTDETGWWLVEKASRGIWSEVWVTEVLMLVVAIKVYHYSTPIMFTSGEHIFYL